MKKLFLTFVALTSLLTMSAQEAKYQGEVDLGYSIGTGTLGTNRVNLHTIHGARIGSYFYAGLGLGLDYYHQLYDDVGDGELMLPIFLDLKGYYPINENLSPFVSLDLGYGIGLTEGVSGVGGFLCAPAAGLKYKNFQAQIGYTSQRFSEGGLGFTSGACQFKIGITF